jgi:hypothetical protein
VFSVTIFGNKFENIIIVFLLSVTSLEAANITFNNDLETINLASNLKGQISHANLNKGNVMRPYDGTLHNDFQHNGLNCDTA